MIYGHYGHIGYNLELAIGERRSSGTGFWVERDPQPGRFEYHAYNGVDHWRFDSAQEAWEWARNSRRSRR